MCLPNCQWRRQRRPCDWLVGVGEREYSVSPRRHQRGSEPLLGNLDCSLYWSREMDWVHILKRHLKIHWVVVEAMWWGSSTCVEHRCCWFEARLDWTRKKMYPWWIQHYRIRICRCHLLARLLWNSTLKIVVVWIHRLLDPMYPVPMDLSRRRKNSTLFGVENKQFSRVSAEYMHHYKRPSILT